MRLIEFVGMKVKIDLDNGHYFEGLVLDADEDTLKLRDKLEHVIVLRKNIIVSIREVTR